MNKKTIYFFLILIQFWTVSCVGQSADSHTPLPNATATLQVGSPSQVVKSTTPDPGTTVVVSSATPTVQAESTLASLSPTLTPLATLSPGESYTRIHRLLRDNAGCRFPCWWGITAGETTWQEANQYLSAFTEINQYQPIDKSGNTSSSEIYYVKFPLETKTNQGGFHIYVTNGQIRIIEVGNLTTIYDLLLSHFLSEYSQPEQIYLQTFEHIQGKEYPMTLVLDYSNFNFMVIYKISAYEKSEDYQVLVSCPNTENPRIIIWSDEEVVTPQRIQDWAIGSVPIIPLKPIDQVTEFTIKSFTENFSYSDAEIPCIQTNRVNWRIDN